MNQNHLGVRRWGFASLLILVGSLGAFILALALRRPGDAAPVVRTRSDQAGSVSDPYQAASEARTEMMKDLLLALKECSRKVDHAKISAISMELAREGDHVVPPVLGALKSGRDWNMNVALLAVLARVRTPSALVALEEFYGTLAGPDIAYKLEIVRILSRMGGGLTRDSLKRLFSRETDSKVHGEIAKSLVAIGLTPEELSHLGKREQDLVEKDVAKKDGQRLKLEALEKLDPKADASLADLKKTALEEGTVAIAILSFRKLEARGDAQAAQILAERAKAKAESAEEKVIQTNALTSLARMTVSDARLSYRGIVLGSDSDLRRQAISLLGSFGDEAMIPVLEQAAKVDPSPDIQRLVDQSTGLIRSRAVLIDKNAAKARS